MSTPWGKVLTHLQIQSEHGTSVAWMHHTKDLFDSDGLLNPGKLIQVNSSGCCRYFPTSCRKAAAGGCRRRGDRRSSSTSSPVATCLPLDTHKLLVYASNTRNGDFQRVDDGCESLDPPAITRLCFSLQVFHHEDCLHLSSIRQFSAW